MLLNMIWSHCRNINVFASKSIIKYSVPIYSEKDWIGKFKSIKIKDNEIEIEFYKKDDTEVKPKENNFLHLE